MIILRYNDTGTRVKNLQRNLIELGYDCGPDGADGEFGDYTLAAVIEFQTLHGLEADGEVGSLTQAAINKAIKTGEKKQTTTTTTTTTTTYSQPVQSLISIATNEIGYMEKNNASGLDDNTANAGGGNYTKYARDLANAGYYNGNKNGYAWCDVFVDWCFWKLAGYNRTLAEQIECQTGDCGAGCEFSAQYYKEAGRWSTSPSVGAQIFFDYGSGLSHTGIVIEVTSSQIVTIEGNTSDKVMKKAYSLYSPYIAGYGLPRFELIQATTNTATNTIIGKKYYQIKSDVVYASVRKEPSPYSRNVSEPIYRSDNIEFLEETTVDGHVYARITDGWVFKDEFEEIPN